MPNAAKWGLLILGFGLITFLIVQAGPEQVWEVLQLAGPWLPLVVVLEALSLSMDVIALRALYGTKAEAVAPTTWVRTGLLHYAVMVLLPAGRVGAEVARTATLSQTVPVALATARGVQLHACVLLANALISLPCLVVVGMYVGVVDKLFGMVTLNALVTAMLGLGLVYGARLGRVGTRLGKAIKQLSKTGEDVDRVLRDGALVPFKPLMWCFTGRVIQTVQYGIILVAVGGAMGVAPALLSQAIHLVGAALGDMIPGQAGVTESVYRLFAPELGFASLPARALGVALVARAAQWLLALLAYSAFALSAWRPQTAVQERVSPGS